MFSTEYHLVNRGMDNQFVTPNIFNHSKLFYLLSLICSPPLGAPDPAPLKVAPAAAHQSLRLRHSDSDLTCLSTDLQTWKKFQIVCKF